VSGSLGADAHERKLPPDDDKRWRMLLEVLHGVKVLLESVRHVVGSLSEVGC